MSVTITFSGRPAPVLPHVDLPALMRALRPWLTPILVATAEAAGLGPFAPVLVGVAVQAALADRRA
jgi:hypothetical protein